MSQLTNPIESIIDAILSRKTKHVRGRNIRRAKGSVRARKIAQAMNRAGSFDKLSKEMD